ncbi:hypothetical protein [Runella rosea]|nr:hypothetical protein [Runella rosea]
MTRLKNETSLLIDEFARDGQVSSFFGGIIKGIADTISAWRALAKEQGFLRTWPFWRCCGNRQSGSFNQIANAAQQRSQQAQGLDYYGPFEGKDAAGRAQQLICSV